MAIFNRYKDTIEDLVDSLNIEPPILPRPVSKRLCNVIANLKDFLTKPKLDNPTEPKLDKDFLDKSPRQ